MPPTLQQHLRDRRRRTEIAIDLEHPRFAGRVRVEKIRPGAVLHQHGDRFPRFVAIQQARAQKSMAQARLHPV
jgi:hypothetical protein